MIKVIRVLLVVVLFIQARALPQVLAAQDGNSNDQQMAPPAPLQAASHISLDGLALVIVFDKPVNLSSLIETVEQRWQSLNQPELFADDDQEPFGAQPPGPLKLRSRANDTSAATPSNNSNRDNIGELFSSREQSSSLSASASASASLAANIHQHQHQCHEWKNSLQQDYETQHLVQGIQICAKLLAKKSLKLLHKYRLYNCLWPTRTQFLIQLAKPVATTQPVKISFQRNSISEHQQGHWQNQPSIGGANEREITVELNKLPLESLGLPLTPRLALTGPNQVPPCGQFSLSAHLFSPYGTWPGSGGASDTGDIKLSWSVERLGFVGGGAANAGSPANQTTVGASPLLSPAPASESQQQNSANELKWRALQHLVKTTKGNNLNLDAQLLNSSPQLYEFHLTVIFKTSVSTVTLNATHQISRIDIEAPIGTIYGSHLLGQSAQINTNQELILLADVKVPECAANIKQVGLFWQVSDPRVRFEQTYAPYYLAKSNTLPEQALIEFRLNLFYGIRVKKYTSSGTIISTGDSVLDSQISDGLLIVSLGQEPNQGQQQADHQLELYGPTGGEDISGDKFTYQWSCFDGKTAQPCYKSLRVLPSNSSTRYEISALSPVLLGAAAAAAAAANRQGTVDPVGLPGGNSQQGNQHQSTTAQSQPPQSSGVLLIDKQKQRQPVLRLPLSWFEPDAQLWFGLQKFDRQNPSQQSHTEYTLVTVQPGSSPLIAIGPVLIGHSRQRATIRNPLTGSVVLLANTPIVIVGRLGSATSRSQIKSFIWHSPNFIQPLHWTMKNSTNSLNNQEELITELHLNPNLIVANAHYQIQLIACSSSGSTTTATLNLDIVQGVSECRVEVNQNALSGNSLLISVDYCNIPPGLSPITYQIYIADTTNSDGLLVQQGSGTRKPQQNGGETTTDSSYDDYINESDEIYLENRLQPLTSPQLSPVFSLNGINALSLLALLDYKTKDKQKSNNKDNDETPPKSDGSEVISSSVVGGNSQARVRFGARVCDRLQNCRLFYSNAIGIKHLLGNNQQHTSSSGNQSTPTGFASLEMLPPKAQLEDYSKNRASLVQSVQLMLDSSKRINTAGNSIAAISVLGGVINLSQRMLDSGGEQQQQQQKPPNRLPLIRQQSDLTNSGDNKIRELLQVAMRDCLLYSQASMQRQFHYTDSGQTNLVTHALAQILNSPQSSLEFKYRAMRLLALITRRSIQEQLKLKSNCLADFKSLQEAYESLYETFGQQHSISQLLASEQSNNGAKHQASALQNSNATVGGMGAANVAANNNKFPLLLTSLSAAITNSNSSAQSSPSISTPFNNQPTNNQHHHHFGHHHHHHAPPLPHKSSSTSRRKREEAILAYLRAIRQAHKALISAAAIQLPLGDTKQFQYVGGELLTTTTTSNNLRTNSPSDNDSETADSSSAPQKPTSDIVSSITHLTEIPSSTIEIDLRDFGTISLKFNEKLLEKLSKDLSPISLNQLKCRNETSGLATASNASRAVGCSSFVLAVSSFAGKAPYRSLDDYPGLRVPILEVSLLSPLDGSNLFDLLKATESQQQQVTSDASADDRSRTGEQQARLVSDDFKTTVTFTVAKLPDAISSANGKQSAQDNGQQTEAAGKQQQQFKCYQFDEDANEWTSATREAATGGDQSAPPDDEGAQVEVIKCSFNALGTYGAFLGKPPPSEAPMRLSIMLAVIGVVGLVILFTLLGCLASNSRERKQRRARENGADDDNEKDTHYHHNDRARHPEQTYRNEFSYPLG